MMTFLAAVLVGAFLITIFTLLIYKMTNYSQRMIDKGRASCRICGNFVHTHPDDDIFPPKCGRRLLSRGDPDPMWGPATESKWISIDYKSMNARNTCPYFVVAPRERKWWQI